MKLSDFGEHFRGYSGITHLMDDLSEGLAQPGVVMLGGGNPAAIPEVKAVLQDILAELHQSGKLVETLANYEDLDAVHIVSHGTDAGVQLGDGWLDADPEIEQIKPDIYAVNEDGDKGGKREYCAQRGMEYLVLKRSPAPGLPPRSSTDLRGF